MIIETVVLYLNDGRTFIVNFERHPDIIPLKADFHFANGIVEAKYIGKGRNTGKMFFKEIQKENLTRHNK